MLTKKHTLIATAVILAGGAAYAGSSGTEFNAAVTTLTDWLTGGLGKAVALAFLAVGLFMGIARQSLMSAAVSVGCAFAVIIGPGILDSVVSGSAAPAELAVALQDVQPEALPVLK